MAQDQKFGPATPLVTSEDAPFEFKPLQIPKVDETLQVVETALSGATDTRKRRRGVCPECRDPNCPISRLFDER